MRRGGQRKDMGGEDGKGKKTAWREGVEEERMGDERREGRIKLDHLRIQT